MVRRGILWRLLCAHLAQPARGLSTFRALRAYRKAQEFLRTSNQEGTNISEAQLDLGSQWTGLSKETLIQNVSRWMEKEPLDLVARSIRKGLAEFLWAAKNYGFKLGVFSDYPADAKLKAMCIADFFDVVVSAQDPEVQRFKPSTRGVEVTLKRLGAESHHALYIGDRPEIDAITATEAGMGCVIIGRQSNGSIPCQWRAVRNYNELRDLLCPAISSHG